MNINLFTKVGPADFSNRLIDAAVEFHQTSPIHPNQADTVGANEYEFVMPLRLQPFASPLWWRTFGSTWKEGNVPSDQLLQHTTLPTAWGQWQSLANRKTLMVATGSRFDLMFMCMHAAVGSSGVALLPDFMTTQLVAARQLKVLSNVQLQTDGGYYLRAAPLLRNSVALRNFSRWLQMLL